MFPHRLLSHAEFASACLYRARASETTANYARDHFVLGLPVRVIVTNHGVSRQAVKKVLERFELAIERMRAAAANDARAR